MVPAKGRCYFLKKHAPFIFKFWTVGLLTAIIYFSIMWLAQDVLGRGYLIAVSVAYVISTAFHFFANRHFTFGAAVEAKHRQIFKYLILLLINYSLTIAIVTVCVEKFGLSAYSGVIASVLVTVFVGYFLSHSWVFKIKGLGS